MFERTDVVYRYDGTFDGFLTAVFEAYSHKRPVAAITHRDEVQMAFGQGFAPVKTDEEKARRVERGILKSFGGAAYHLICKAFWSGEYDKDTILYRYIRAGFAQGRRIYNDLTHPDVLSANYMLRNLEREEQRVLGFVRFSLMENGVYYGNIAPKNNLVPVMMPHFADRFNDMPFLLHDTAHGMAGVYDLQGWYLVEADELTLPDFAEGEHEWRRAWRRFYDAIAVQGRINEKQRRTMMPKFYWKNMPEFAPRYAPSQPERRTVALDVIQGRAERSMESAI